MVAGGMKCIKYLIFFFNFVFVILGIALISLGAVVHFKYQDYVDFLGDKFFSVPILLIIVGVIIFIVGFFGCCGAIKENHCMTITFGVLLALILILELAAGIAAYVLRNDLHDILDTNMKKSMMNFNTTGHGGVNSAWNGLQHEQKCCGTFGYKDWLNVSSVIGGNVPDSCCIEDTLNCGVDKANMGPGVANATIYTRGCLSALENFVSSNILVFGGVGIGFAFVQIVGIVFACCLAQNIRKEYETV